MIEMDEAKRKRLEAKGFKVGTVAEFLGLTPEEAMAVEIHAALARLLRDVRAEQSQVAGVENHDPGTSTDTLLLALLKAGATPQRIGEAIAAVNAQMKEEKPSTFIEDLATAGSTTDNRGRGLLQAQQQCHR